MDNPIFFIQQAVSLKYLDPTHLSGLFQRYSYDSIPQNIDEICIAEGLLTAEQVQKIKSHIAPNPNRKTLSGQSLTLSLAGGESISIDIPAPILIEDDRFSGSAEQESVLEQPRQANDDERDLLASQYTVVDNVNIPEQRDLASHNTILLAETNVDSQIPGISIDIEVEDKIPDDNTVDMTAVDIEPPAPMSRDSTIRNPDDIELAKSALAEKKISYEQLQVCLEEQKRLSQSGESVSLARLLIDKALLSEGEIASLKREKATIVAPQVSPEDLRELGGEPVLMEKYQVVCKLGSGGMGSVYKVEHLMLEHNKFFALKIMHPFIASNEGNYRRFIREVEAAMSLTHKNLVPIREFGTLPNKSPYLTMDFCEGRPLDKILRDNWQKDIPRSLRIVRQILDGLMEAHRNGIIHRDLKPANLLVEEFADEDLVRIVDFGLAKLVEHASLESLTQGTVGTPHYMSPEQAAGEKVDHRTDIYAVGIILYEMVLGKLPFQSDSLRQMLKMQMFDPPPPPRTEDPSLDVDLENIILKALAKKVEDRYATAKEFVDAIDAYLAKKEGKKSQFAATPATAIPSRPPTVPGPEESRKKLPVRLIAIVAVVVCIVVGISAIIFKSGSDAQSITPPSGETDEQRRVVEFRRLFESAREYEKDQLWRDARSELEKAEKIIRLDVERDKVTQLDQLLRRRIREQKLYSNMINSVNSYQAGEEYDLAITYLHNFLEQNPGNVYQREIEKRLEFLRNKIRDLFQTQKNQVIFLKTRKLWQQALEEVAKLENKVPAGDPSAHKEVQILKQEIENKLAEEQDFTNTQREVQIQREQQSYNKAIALWEAYLAKHPTSERQKDIASKIEALRLAGAHSQNKQLQQLFFNASQDYAQKRFPEAILKLKEALTYGEDDRVLALLGKVHYQIKHYSEAMSYLERSQLSDIEGVEILTRLYLKKRQIKKALSLLQKSAARFAQEGDIAAVANCHYILGQIYEKGRKTGKAVQYYKKAVDYIGKTQDRERHCEWAKHLGLLLFDKLRNKREALPYLSTYQNLGGEDDKAIKALVSLTDYTPASYGRGWQYQVDIRGRKSTQEYKVIAIDQRDKFIVKVSGMTNAQETWYREHNAFVKEFGKDRKETVLQYPVQLQGTWKDQVGRREVVYKIVAINETVTVLGNTFRHCIKVEQKLPTSPDNVTYVYYAPRIGEVKTERMKSRSVFYTRELVKYTE